MGLARLLALAIICVVAYVMGELGARVHVPRLPVYLAAGAVAGVLVKHASESANLAFPILNPVTLCVIGFVAGSHLVWSTLKPRIKPIGLQVAGITIGVPFVVGTAIYMTLPSEAPASAKAAVAILAGTVMLALSPPEAIAIVSESDSKGPFTTFVLGATVVMDVVVVSMFSVALTVAKVLLGEQASVAALVGTIVLSLVGALIGGLIVGTALRAIVRRVERDSLAQVLIFIAAGVAVGFATLANEWIPTALNLHVEIEPLLVAMIAGLFVANMAAHSERFARLLEGIAPWVYVVFFTLTGLGLHVETLLAALGSAVLLWALRIAGLWVGSKAAMSLAQEPEVVKRVAWRGFVPQAGIALALAATISAEFPQSGPAFASVIIGTIVINEATGPFFLKSALRAAGESAPEGEAIH